MRVAIIGNGGREHAIEWKVASSIGYENVFTLPGNGGTANNIQITDFEEIRKFCKHKEIDLLIVGPEQPLAAGIVDALSHDCKVFGPNKKAAQLETSKAFSKEFMFRNGIATAAYKTITKKEDMLNFAEQYQGNVVLKYDGLAAGKGVYVCSNIKEAELAYDDVCNLYGSQAVVVIEERLIGNEISMIGFCDGKTIKMLLPSQDHKQAFEDDSGPNTGGMGAYCPVPNVNQDMLVSIYEEVIAPTMKGLQNDGIDYRGILYFGIMYTKEGPKLLEYNVRLGDPEAEVLLPALKTDLIAICMACMEGTLDTITIEFNSGYYVDVVLVSEGYPGDYTKGYEITGLDNLPGEAMAFHAGTANEDGNTITSGGRVLNIVAHGEDLQSAIENAYRFQEMIHFKGKRIRSDIGKRKWL